MIIINLKISAKLRINFFYFFLNLIDDFLFFDSLFSKMNFKYVLSHIHYDTNNIKNYLLKKKCNGISMVIQKNINAKNQTGFFYHSDIVLTYGNKVKINENTKSYIGKQIPIGSFFMEYYYYTKPTNTKEGYDILCLGGNEHYPNSANDRSKFHRVDYIEHLNWLINISNEYPNLSIGFMHHANNKNKFEENFLKKSNIKIIEKNKNSYEISFNSKFICSWASSMIIEMQSLKKNSFYLDPKNRNNQFLGDISSSLNIRINSYEDFKNKVENLILKNMKDKQVLNFNLDDFCYVSDNCSEKIYELIVKNN